MKPSTAQSHRITVATFDRPDAAEAFHRHLSTRIIDSVVVDERNVQRFWFLAPRRSGVHVQVTPELAQTARTHLTVWEQGLPESHRPNRCPHCGSSRVEFPQLGRNFILPTLMGHLAVAFGLQKHRHYCQDCHETWEDGAAAPLLPAKPKPRSV